MSTHNNDPDFPTITLDPEDRDAFQRARKNTNKKTKPEKKPETESKSSGGSGPLVIFAFIIALGACAASYWLYTLNAQQSTQLSDAEARIAELERRLSATGEELDQSAVATQVKVTELAEKTDELWSQMDKLWASAWRRNQADIKALEKSTDQSLSGLKNQVGVIEEESSVATTNLALLQEQMGTQITQLQELAVTLSQVDKADTALKRQLGDVQAKLLAAEQVNSALTRRIAELEKWKNQRTTATPASPPAAPSNSPGTTL